MTRTRVLVVCPERLGAQMAGPAIRALELARVLAAHCEVTIAAPAPSTVEDDRLRLVQAGFEDYGALLEQIARCDVLVAQQLPTRLLHQVARMPVRIVADLYNPTIMEVLEYGRRAQLGERRRLRRLAGYRAVAHLAAADFVICASERQRDMWLGVMGVCGLLGGGGAGSDPAGRDLIDVVPFGLSGVPPVPGPPAIRGAWPQIAPEDHVLLWGGGIWNWLDPATVIEATALLADSTPAVHLCFLGTDRPDPREGSPLPDHALTAGSAARELAEQLGLAGTRVHFNDGWVPYEDRGRWLLEADLGVSAHHDHLESRFSFRTRILDCVWASLPVVCTRGDTLSELVEERGMGIAVAPGDAAAFAASCRSLLEDPARMAAARAAIARAAREFTWEAAGAPLVEWCTRADDRGPQPRRRRLMTAATIVQYPDMLAQSRHEDGPKAAGARLLRNLARALGR